MAGLKVSMICLIFMASVKSIQAQQNAMTLHATCDDRMKVYFDGELQPETDAMKWWEAVSQLSIPAGTRVLAIECKDVGMGGGVLASTSTGLKTDSSWRCSNEVIEGWTQPGFVFPPDTFASANTLGNNTVSPWINDNLGPRPDIQADAQWIWAAGSTGAWAGCRIEIGPNGLCPSSYIYTAGDVAGWGSLPGGGLSSVDNIETCAGHCDANSNCCSFEYSPMTKKCNLNSECQPTKDVFEDFNFCVKAEAPSTTPSTTPSATTSTTPTTTPTTTLSSTQSTTPTTTGDSVKWVPAPITLLAILLLLF